MYYQEEQEHTSAVEGKKGHMTKDTTFDKILKILFFDFQYQSSSK